jgi:hypothetical protein
MARNRATPICNIVEKGTVMPKVDFHTDLKKAVPTRHTALRTSAAATTALAHAAAKLSFGVWDHWVHFRV